MLTQTRHKQLGWCIWPKQCANALIRFACKAGGVHFWRDYRSPPNVFSSTVSPYTCFEFTKNAKYSNWGTHTLYSCSKLGHCNFTRLDLSETAQLIGGGKKIGNYLTCKMGQRRIMRERKEFSRSSFSQLRSMHKKLECECSHVGWCVEKQLLATAGGGEEVG